MRRLHEPAAYAARSGAYWADTVQVADWPTLAASIRCDTAVIGGGFTGLNAALALASDGDDVAVFEAESPGWGASGRNGGFCCLGGALVSDATLVRRHGPHEAALWQQAQSAAVDHVRGLLSRHAIEADTHSSGETELAHSPKAWRQMQRDAAKGDTLHAPSDLARDGLGGPWFGGLTRACGFALNPAKYHAGLAGAARAAGAHLHARSAVTALAPEGDGWRLTVRGHPVLARRVILATNGYSSEDLPRWLAGRSLPVFSSVIVTRPLTPAERAAAGWWSDQMCYDSRRLLHYFRLLPEGRFLFGMRGGLGATPRETASTNRRIRADFARLFPAWKDVEISHAWSGLVCLMASGTPFVGPVPGAPGLFAALGFHGNGVAMGSYAGHLLADHVRGRAPAGPCPGFLSRPPRRFPFGRHRRHLLRPVYALAELFDL